ncbi:DUF722 domain-containing protein [Lactococcus lactis]|uniref:RinA family protein n=1 Tax=Lactococcus lactis TaxID=1358 RepID=UPI00223ABE29|nr:RinA family protein [Lactococcus lactis]MCT1183957.1 DUF722 domain-containing protein [Lactococcus lactis]MCT1228209.1 DUF722 domain-containing protein [Lactococcus lactis]
MADRLDLLLSDYMTGMLQVKINSRERWITREKHEERIGSGGSSSNTAPQERNYLIKEADKELGRLKDAMKTLDDLFNVFDGTVVHKIIIYKYKYRMTWDQVSIRMHTDQSALRKQYVKFKNTLRSTLWASTLGE